MKKQVVATILIVVALVGSMCVAYKVCTKDDKDYNKIKNQHVISIEKEKKEELEKKKERKADVEKIKEEKAREEQTKEEKAKEEKVKESKDDLGGVKIDPDDLKKINTSKPIDDKKVVDMVDEVH